MLTRSGSSVYKALEVLREYVRKVLDGACALDDLIFRTHVSKGCDEYRQFNNQIAAMKQMILEGIKTLPGQTIGYIKLTINPEVTRNG